MIADASKTELPDDQRIVITGIGLTAPNGNNLGEFRESLLAGKSGVADYEIRYFGKTFAGVCDFDERKHQSRKTAGEELVRPASEFIVPTRPLSILELTGKILTEVGSGFISA